MPQYSCLLNALQLGAPLANQWLDVEVYELWPGRWRELTVGGMLGESDVHVVLQCKIWH